MAELDESMEVGLQPLNPLSIINKAIDAGAGVDALEKLMDLQERWEKRQARKAFDEAMMKFQAECPIIKKIKEGGQTKAGQTAYHYAPLEYIVEQTKEYIAKNGFSYLINLDFPEAGKVKAICKVRHTAGHEEQSVMEVPMMRQTGVMSEAQVVAATTTFAKRYAFCNAFGIMTMDDDTDAVDEDTIAKFNNILKQWDVKNHLVSVANTITSKNAFRQLVDSLPTTEQLNKFKELLLKVDKQYHYKLWTDFQKQTNQSADGWLEKLSQSRLIKE